MTLDGHDPATCTFCDFAADVAARVKHALASGADLNNLRAPERPTP